MKFDEFEQLAWREWAKIPERFKGGVDALIIERDAKAHPQQRDVYTLGECLTETYLSDFGGPDTIRSAVVLYYGSFRRLAGMDPEFDWELEVWETLTHELQHHLESLAAEDRLEDVDSAAEENFKRVDGEPFDPLFYIGGENMGGGWYRVEDTWFLEVEPGAESRIELEWRGKTYRVQLPPSGDEVVFVTVEGVEDPPAELCVVLRRAHGGLRGLLRRDAPRAGRLVAQAEPVGREA